MISDEEKVTRPVGGQAYIPERELHSHRNGG